MSATYVINDLPMRLRDTRFALKLAAGLGAVILLFAVYSSASSPASTASAAMFSNPAGIVTTPTATATTASATTASAKPTTARRQTPATVRPAGMTGAKRSVTASQASRPRTTPAKSTKAAAKPATNSAPATVTTPAQTTTQTVTVTTPAPATPAPPATKTTPVSTPPTSAPPLGTLTNAAFNKLPVNQITRGVIISVFGAPATAKQLQSALGTKWLTAVAQGLPAGTSCVYYFDRSGKAQTFQLCFDASHMLVLKQALKDSAASGSA